MFLILKIEKSELKDPLINLMSSLPKASCGARFHCSGLEWSSTYVSRICINISLDDFWVHDRLNYVRFQKMGPPKFEGVEGEDIYEFLILCHEMLEAMGLVDP